VYCNGGGGAGAWPTGPYGFGTDSVVFHDCGNGEDVGGDLDDGIDDANPPPKKPRVHEIGLVSQLPETSGAPEPSCAPEPFRAAKPCRAPEPCRAPKPIRAPFRAPELIPALKPIRAPEPFMHLDKLIQMSSHPSC
jgi:hypothetical protein